MIYQIALISQIIYFATCTCSKSYQHFIDLYNISLDCLRFNQLLLAIPKIWKNKLQKKKKDEQLVCLPQMRSQLTEPNINKIIYKWNLHTTGAALFPHRTCLFWEDENNAPIPWRIFFLMIYNTTIDSYSRIFQFKTFCKIIATK